MSTALRVDFYYLAGPMTGIPEFNIPRFNEVANDLRGKGYVIQNPAEMDHQDEINADGISSEDGWQECLRRDVNIVMDEWCIGVICLEGWEKSKGARLETFVAEAFGKPLYLYADGDLIVIDRTRYLTAMEKLDSLVDRAEDEAFEALTHINSLNGGR